MTISTGFIGNHKSPITGVLFLEQTWPWWPPGAHGQYVDDPWSTVCSNTNVQWGCFFVFFCACNYSLVSQIARCYYWWVITVYSSRAQHGCSISPVTSICPTLSGILLCKQRLSFYQGFTISLSLTHSHTRVCVLVSMRVHTPWPQGQQHWQLFC